MDTTTLPQKESCESVHSKPFAEEEHYNIARERYNEWRGENLRELKSDFLSSLHTTTLITWLLEENEDSYFSTHAQQFDEYCEKCFEEEECYYPSIWENELTAPLDPHEKEEGENK